MSLPGRVGPRRRASCVVAGCVVAAAIALLASSTVIASQVPPTGTIEAFVGGGIGDGGSATEAVIDPRGLVVVNGAAGGQITYIADGFGNRVRRISNGIIETIAGTGVGTYGGDNGLAVNAALYFPLDVLLDNAGNLYIADTSNDR